MKITVLNGSPAESPLNSYLDQLTKVLSYKNEVTLVNLRDEDISYCIGCFGCWVKTPGECSTADGSDAFRKVMIQSDFTLWAAPMKMGFPHHLLKMALDKSIPLVHPYIIVDQKEAHHLPRYTKYPRFGLLVSQEPDTIPQDIKIVERIFSRTAVNIKSNLEFCLTTQDDPKTVAGRITSTNVLPRPHPKYLSAIPGETIQPPKHITIFNGSPRGAKGNTPRMLTRFGEGFSSVGGHTISISHLNRIKDHPEIIQQYKNAECVWLGFPLYTDAMPGLVKTFIEALEPFKDRQNNPPIGFLVQSGFPEALHSRYIEAYLQGLASRLNAPYLGTIVKGGGEGVRFMADDAKLFTNLKLLGKSFALNGNLDSDLLKPIAGLERYHPILVPLFKFLVKLPIMNSYFDNQLKANGVYEERFAQPYRD